MPLVYEYLAAGRSQGLHLLIHPVWWVGRGTNPSETLDFLDGKNSEFLNQKFASTAKHMRLKMKNFEINEAGIRASDVATFLQNDLIGHDI